MRQQEFSEQSALRHQGHRRPALETLATDVAGLDVVLRGGLVTGGIYLIGGRPGTGKTTLGNQLAHNHVRRGGRVIFATVLAETHSRMIAHLRGFEFFNIDLVADQVQYLSLFDQLISNGVEAVEDLLRSSVREHGATMLVIDGVGLIGESVSTAREFREFVHDLHTQMAAMSCTTLLLSDLVEDGISTPIGTHVDGIILLEDHGTGIRDVRFLHPIKIRGVDFLRGKHAFEITPSGIEVYPRLEAIASQRLPDLADAGGKVPFGIRGLDDMLQGGLQPMSSVLLLGAPGSGKTMTGLHFVSEGIKRGERGIIVSFHEAPNRLLGKASSIGLDLESATESGELQVLWHPLFETRPDVIGAEILDAVSEHEPQRVFIDGISDVWRTASYPERVPSFLSALVSLLIQRGVTILMSDETHASLEQQNELPVRGMSAIIDSMISLRYQRVGSRLHRMVSIVKSRSQGHETSVREFTIGPHGIDVALSSETAESLLAVPDRYFDDFDSISKQKRDR